jgi:hypothetical protein
MILQIVPPLPPAGPPGGFTQGPFVGPCGDIACVPIDQAAILVMFIGLLIGTYNMIRNNGKRK